MDELNYGSKTSPARWSSVVEIRCSICVYPHLLCVSISNVKVLTRVSICNLTDLELAHTCASCNVCKCGMVCHMHVDSHGLCYNLALHCMVDKGCMNRRNHLDLGDQKTCKIVVYVINWCNC